MSVKRYDCYPGVDGYMHESDDGDYVRYEDCTDLRRAAPGVVDEIRKLEAELNEARAALARATQPLPPTSEETK